MMADVMDAEVPLCVACLKAWKLKPTALVKGGRVCQRRS